MEKLPPLSIKRLLNIYMFISISTKRTKLIHIQIYVALLLFAMEFLGVLVQMVAWGLKKVPKKFEDFPLCHNHNRMIKNCFCKHLFVDFWPRELMSPFLSIQGHHELSRAISHQIWFGINEGHNDEEYWKISLKADVSLSLIGREKSSRVLS